MKWLFLLLPLALLAEQLFNVTTTTVQERLIAKKETFDAKLELDERYLYDITPRFDGFVERLIARKLYQHVKRGEPLVVVYSPLVYKTKLEYQNARHYGDKKMIRALRKKLLLLGVHSFDASSSFTIPSPIDGTIIQRSIDDGSAFGKRQPLFRVASLRHMKATFYFPQRLLSFVERTKSFTIVFNDHHFQGSLLTLHPLVAKKSGYIQASLYLTSPTPLVAGAYAKVVAKTEPKRLLVVPKESVIKKRNGWYIFVQGDFEGEYEPKKVKIEPLDDRYFAIEGVPKGTIIVARPMFLIDSDAQINGMMP